jgi:hypothetical protein
MVSIIKSTTAHHHHSFSTNFTTNPIMLHAHNRKVKALFPHKPTVLTSAAATLSGLHQALHQTEQHADQQDQLKSTGSHDTSRDTHPNTEQLSMTSKHSQHN